MALLLILCGVTSFVVCALLLRWGQESARRYGPELPQRFHVGHVPRLGGAAMFVACSVGWAWMALAPTVFGIDHAIPFEGPLAWTWWLVALSAVAAGVVEDVTHRLPVRLRFISTSLAALFGTIMFGLNVTHVDIPVIDMLWSVTPWFGLFLAMLGLAGLPHAFNIIDGYNGLAGTVTFVCSLALAYVAIQVGDRQLAAVAPASTTATAGFLLWNYPYGLIFAGDGGAYLWGIVIGLTAIQLVQRHSQVSPWFPALLLIYPVWETLFSMYRKLMRGQSPASPMPCISTS
jgi:UDP-GlcNAc:undecaprenyl-phosphate/decaprenyl-phosphate GlcNAc-1-phosphate transferase